MTSPEKKPCAIAAQRMQCADCVEFLIDYVEGALPAERRFEFESHIAFCPDCDVFLANYRKAAALARETGADLHQLAPDPMPTALADAILRARKQS